MKLKPKIEKQLLEEAFKAKYGKTPEEAIEDINEDGDSIGFLIGERCDKCGKKFHLGDKFYSVTIGIIDAIEGPYYEMGATDKNYKCNVYHYECFQLID